MSPANFVGGVCHIFDKICSSSFSEFSTERCQNQYCALCVQSAMRYQVWKRDKIRTPEPRWGAREIKFTGRSNHPPMSWDTEYKDTRKQVQHTQANGEKKKCHLLILLGGFAIFLTRSARVQQVQQSSALSGVKKSCFTGKLEVCLHWASVHFLGSSRLLVPGLY